MKNGLRVVVVVIAVIYGVFSSKSSYHEFDSGVFDISADTHDLYPIVSEESSPVKIELTATIGGQTFDAYLMTQVEYQKLEEWMNSVSLEQPQINYIRSWENVSQVDEGEIIIGKGKFYLVVDNTILGHPNVEGQSIGVRYQLSEKY